MKLTSRTSAPNPGNLQTVKILTLEEAAMMSKAVYSESAMPRWFIRNYTFLKWGVGPRRTSKFGAVDRTSSIFKIR